MTNTYIDRPDWGLPEDTKQLLLPEGIVIPVFQNGVIKRVKTRWGERYPKYLPIAGGENVPMIFRNPHSKAVMVVESELDAILLDQEVGNLISVIGMGSASNRPDKVAHELLKGAELALFSFDADLAGRKAWSWWKSHYNNSRRWPPIEEKDPCEAYQNGVDLREWVVAGMGS